MNDRLANDRFSTVLYGSFAVIALLLAAVGIYSVMAFTEAQRTHEIGLCLAFGASRERVLGLVLREALTLALLGLLVGLGGAYAVGHTLSSMLYGVTPHDFGVLAAVGLTLLLAALVGSYLPAWRAAKLDPMRTLRYE